MTSRPDLASPPQRRQSESLRLLRRVMGLGGEVREVLAARVDLSTTELEALEHLERGPLGPAEIARKLDVSTAAATGIVDRLERKGHAERHPHPRDRRRQDVVMTPHARDEVIRHMSPMFRAIGEVDAGLTDSERDVVVRYLTAAIAAGESVLEGSRHDPQAEASDDQGAHSPE